MPIRVRLGDHKESLIEEASEFRGKMLDYFQESGLHCNHQARLYVNFDPSKFDAWNNYVTAQTIFSFHKRAPIKKLAQKVHPLKGDVFDENGNPVLEEMDIFPDPPNTQFSVDLRHDGNEWTVRILVQDLQRRIDRHAEISLGNLQFTRNEVEVRCKNLWSEDVLMAFHDAIQVVKTRTESLYVRTPQMLSLEKELEAARATARIDDQLSILGKLGALYYEAGFSGLAVKALTEEIRLKEAANPVSVNGKTPEHNCQVA